MSDDNESLSVENDKVDLQDHGSENSEDPSDERKVEKTEAAAVQTNIDQLLNRPADLDSVPKSTILPAVKKNGKHDKNDKHGKQADRRNSDDSKNSKTKNDNKKVEKKVKGSALEAMGVSPQRITEVEDKLKAREQTQFTVMSIEVSKLVSAHRFVKNCPWIKAFYGTNYTWVAEYTEGPLGDTAIWKDLRWTINLERNDTDRSDFVVTVCSKFLIIGRYILSKQEFSHIPNTSTGYFEITGDIVNGSGCAGNIRILCLKGVAQRPVAPAKYPGLGLDETVSPHDYVKPVNTSLAMKIVSMAAVDLKSVHIFENNSPQVTVECKDWVGITDVVRGAGIAARWNALNWKFIVKQSEGVIVSIKSNDVLIGKVFISFEEINIHQTDETMVQELIKHLTNGKEISGKIKINFCVDIDYTGAVAGTTMPLLNSKSKSRDDNDYYFPALTNGDGEEIDTEYPMYNTLNLTPPFLIRVISLTVLDVVKVHYVASNSLTVNIACGAYGFVTEEIKNCGQFAHWVDLNWEIVVMKNSYFRVNIWSRGKTIGNASMNVDQLLHMPIDSDGKTELFAKLMNNKQEIVGKAKLSCRYEKYTLPEIKIVTPTKPSPAKSKLNSNNSVLNGGNSVVTNNMQVIPSQQIQQNIENNEFLAPENYDYDDDLRLPVLAVVKLVALYDLISNNKLLKMTPSVRITCDRKSATTSANKVMQWTDLNWAMIVRGDSTFTISVLNGKTLIGQAAVDPESLVSIPCNRDGLTEIKLQLSNGGVSTGKVKILFELKNEEIEEPVYDPQGSPNAVPLFGVGGSLAPVPPPIQFGTSSYAYNSNNYNQTYDNNDYQPSMQFAYQDRNQQQLAPLIFDPAVIHNNENLGFKVVLFEIDVHDVQKAHVLKTNSLSVSAACAKWTEVTKTLENAGPVGFWTGLNWNIEIRNSSNLRLTVTSRGQAIGTVSFSLKSLVAVKSDNTGIKRITEQLYNNNKVVGSIKLTFAMEVSRPTAPAPATLTQETLMSTTDPRQQSGVNYNRQNMMNSNTSQQLLPQPNYGQNLLSPSIPPPRPKVLPKMSTLTEEEEELLDVRDFPFNCTVIDISTAELVAVHLMKKNKPRVKIMCDQFYEETAEKISPYGLDVLLWKDINWVFPIQSAESTVKIYVDSGEVNIGTGTIDGQILKNVPKDEFGLRECIVNISDLSGANITGRVRVVLKVTKIDQLQLQLEMEQHAQNRLQMQQHQQLQQEQQQSHEQQQFGQQLSLPDIHQTPGYLQQQQQQDYMRGGHNQQQQQYGEQLPSDNYYPNNSINNTPFTPQQTQQNLPYNTPNNNNLQQNSVISMTSQAEFVGINIFSIMCIDLPSVHSFVANSPCVNIACGKFIAVTEEQDKAGSHCEWTTLKFSFNFEQRATLRILVSSKGKVIGNCSLSRQKLLSGKRHPQGHFTAFAELFRQDDIPAGKIKLMYFVQ